MLLIVLVEFVHTIYGQHVAESLPQHLPHSTVLYRGSPQTHYGASQPDYYPQQNVIIKPVWLPEYPASQELLIPRRHHSRGSSSDNDSNDCPRVITSCKSSRSSLCFEPEITYHKDRCKKAFVSCDKYGEEALLVTNTGDILSDRSGVSRTIKCRNGRWSTTNIYGDHVRFRGLRCIQ
ncbi:hypothetical protein DICVIV_13749 [Dictyocaulus viviparus]|uniref:Sushi domain-containing protein n=1 Tax=Dictyocaulus viviparus TaxID=29172 RepID=A0A0D8X6Z6_DICVI|nr:hypothetical protein DICVIV_13749 [Dictyocaulus viviparus]